MHRIGDQRYQHGDFVILKRPDGWHIEMPPKYTGQLFPVFERMWGARDFVNHLMNPDVPKTPAQLEYKDWAMRQRAKVEAKAARIERNKTKKRQKAEQIEKQKEVLAMLAREAAERDRQQREQNAAAQADIAKETLAARDAADLRAFLQDKKEVAKLERILKKRRAFHWRSLFTRSNLMK